MERFFFFAGIADRIETGNPDRIEYRLDGNVGNVLPGILFLVVGVGLLWLGLFGAVPNLSITSVAQAVVVLPFVGLFWLSFVTVCVWIGCRSAFGRSGIAIDNVARTMTQWWSLPLWRRSVVHRLSEYSQVGTKLAGRGCLTGPSYLVFLARPDGSILNLASVDLARAEQVSTEIAEFLGYRRLCEWS